MYLGNQPALSYTSFAKQDFTTSATTSYTLDQPVANANEIALFINFVRQEPTTAYTASGTTLTLTSATSASDDMYCVYLGKAVQTVTPPAGSVGTSQLVDSSVSLAKLSATGTKDATTFLRGDNSFQTVSSYADSDALSLFNASGSAPVYACRAWVNFNGTGTVAIRGSGNVSSITDNGTGSYDINFTTAMADTNYAVVGNSIAVYSTPAQQFQFGGIYAADNTTDFNVTGRLVDNDSLTFVASDIESVMVGVFR